MLLKKVRKDFISHKTPDKQNIFFFNSRDITYK